MFDNEYPEVARSRFVLGWLAAEIDHFEGERCQTRAERGNDAAQNQLTNSAGEV